MPRAATPGKTKRSAEPSRGVDKARARGFDTGSKAGAMLVSPDKPLTDMQRSFVKHWAEGNPISVASRMAGYADGGTSAYRMAHQPNVLALYNEEKRAYEEASQMTRKQVVEGLKEAIDLARMMAEPATMVQGWKTIGQMCGYFAPVEVKHTHTHGGKIVSERLNALSDEELLELIAKGATGALPAPTEESADGSTGHGPDGPDEAGAA